MKQVQFLRKGKKLPKRDSEWSTANKHLKSALLLNGPIKSQDLNTSIQVLNDVIYNYFADNFGHTETIPDKNLINKYKDHTVKNLKKALRNLKLTNSDITEIKYVSRALRDKLRDNNKNTQTDTNHDESFNHDKYLERNFWGYVKKCLKQNGQYYHPSACQNASITSGKYWQKFIRLNYFKFQVGFLSYVILKLNLTLTPPPNLSTNNSCNT
jgi:hypothetical protein